MTPLQKILFDEGPMISSELAKKFAAVSGIKINAASQRISRELNIEKISGFFKSNQSFVFLPDHVKDGSVYPALSEVMRIYGQKYWNTLNAVYSNGGVIDRLFLECYTSYPIEPLKSHIPFDEVMKMFVGENILVAQQTQYALSPKLHPKSSSRFVGNTMEQIKISVLDHFSTWCKNTGLVSFETGQKFAEFGKFRWGFKGVSAISGLRQNGNLGFVVADILLGRQIYKEDVTFFIDKLEIVQSFKNSSRLLPYFLVDDLHPDALRLLKEKGIVIGFISELFGDKYSELLKELIAILKGVENGLTGATPDKYLELIKELRRYNTGLLNNIKGALFEYMVAHIHVMKGSKIEIGREIYDTTGSHEIDVKAEGYDYITFAECKAYKAPISTDKINSWIRRKVPAFKRWHSKQENLNKLKFSVEYWSATGFTDEALEMLLAFKEKATFPVRVFGPEQIHLIASETNNKNLEEALNTYFLGQV
jgi:hypothetical protein